MRDTPSRRNPGRSQQLSKPYSRGHLPVFFAQLETARQPRRVLDLVIDQSIDGQRKINFSPLVFVEGAGLAIGLVDIPNRHLELRGWQTLAWRGRKGGKAAEQLTVICRCPLEILNWPKPKYRGLVKSITDALGCIEQVEVSSELKGWTAIRFALDGFVNAGYLAAKHSAAEMDELCRPECVDVTGDLLIWRGYSERMAGLLNRRLLDILKHNPLLVSVDTVHIEEWLGIKNPDLAETVLATFARQHSLAVNTVGIPHVRLNCAEFAGQPVEPKTLAIIDAILAEYHADGGRSRVSLSNAYPSHRNLVAWLFEAHVLVEGLDGFVFTQEELHEFARILNRNPGDPPPSVRTIKDQLGLARKKAESLRLLYAGRDPQRYSQPAGASD